MAKAGRKKTKLVADANGNTMHLKGLECPECGNSTKLRIGMVTSVEQTDWEEDLDTQLEHPQDYWASCPECDYDGYLTEFRAAYADRHGALPDKDLFYV